jgi:hypothetical protein
MAGNGGAIQRLFRIETVRGAPAWVAGHKLTPVARVVSFGRARGTIGSRRIGGLGGGFFHVAPLALIEDTPQGERRIAVSNPTTAALAGLLGAALAVTLFFTAIRWLARRRHGTPTPPPSPMG